MSFNQYIIFGGLIGFTVLFNLPFGFLRTKTRKYSWRWLLCIHLPVPFIYVLRRLFMSGSYLPVTISMLVISAILGQVLGGRIGAIKGS